jgi:hypothetical protein
MGDKNQRQMEVGVLHSGKVLIFQGVWIQLELLRLANGDLEQACLGRESCSQGCLVWIWCTARRLREMLDRKGYINTSEMK